MTTKKEDLENCKRIYADYLKWRKKPNNEERFEAGFDFGYEGGLFAAWSILHENRDAIIESKEMTSGFFRKYHASFSADELMHLVMDYKNADECDSIKKYKSVECICEKCGNLK